MQNYLKYIFFTLSLLATNIYAKDVKVIYAVALVGMNMSYSEYDDNGALFDTEESTFSEITGVDMSYKYLFNKEDESYDEIDFDVLYVSGYSDYTGSLLNSNNPFGSVTSKTLNDIIDFALEYTQNRKINTLVSANYGLGIGYRYWQRKLSRTQIEEYKWFSIRPTLGVDLNVFDDVFVNLKAQYQYAISPKMSASNVNSDFTLGAANILKFDVGLSYILGEYVDVFVDMTYEKQTITKSDTIVEGNRAYYEPASTAYNKYVKIGLAFKY